MKKIINIGFALVFLFSIVGCRSTKETATETIVKDSLIYKTNTVIKDSIITIILPRDTVFIKRFIEKDRFNIIKNIDTIIVENGIIGAKAWVYKSNLGVKAYVSDSTLYYKLDSARISVTKFKELYEIERTKQTKTNIVYKNNMLGRIGIWWLIISVVILFIVFVLKIKGF